MDACADCQGLHNKLSSEEPHAGLKLTGSRKHRSMGNASGVIEEYRCENCRAVLMRDLDRKDSGASWWIQK